ncbi:NAD(P)H-binding protein [Streptomyces sp. NPDC048272]|uniref:SDR family oxidoreductase n=1 Tax=Streptomyces sp. NPDC048272 TaxID=3154616 RepID=UPI003433BCB6
MSTEHPTHTVLVTGGTGTLGSLVVARLREAGHEVRALSRRSAQYPVDLRDGSGLDAAMAGVDVVVHCASNTRRAGRGDEAAARNLAEAARRAGSVRHFLYISIVGVDVVPLAYYRTKLRVERLLERAAPGLTILRTTQFHGLVAQMTDVAAKLPVVLLPKGVRIQPIAVEEVADRLVELAVRAPAGRVPDMGGPEALLLTDLARTYLTATGRHPRVVPVPLAGTTYAAFLKGGNLTPPGAGSGKTFAEFAAGRRGRS